jgi:hypothetical protein
MAHIHQLVRARGEDLIWRAALRRGWRVINFRLGRRLCGNSAASIGWAASSAGSQILAQIGHSRRFGGLRGAGEKPWRTLNRRLLAVLSRISPGLPSSTS